MAWLDRVDHRIPRDWTAHHLVATLQDQPIDAIVVVESAAGERASRRLLERAADVGLPVAVVGNVNLADCHSSATIDRLRTSRGGKALRGIRLTASSGPDWAQRTSNDVRIAKLREADLLVEILTGRASLHAVVDFAAATPTLPIVIDHVGGIADRSVDDRTWLDTLDRLANCPKVMMKLSGWRTPEPPEVDHIIRRVVASFGVDRLMIGSDWPMSAAAGTYAQTIDATIQLLSWLPPQKLDRILSENALRVYRPWAAGIP